LVNRKGISQYPFSLVDGETLNENGNYEDAMCTFKKKRQMFIIKISRDF